jgi:HEAT repeat protein
VRVAIATAEKFEAKEASPQILSILKKEPTKKILKFDLAEATTEDKLLVYQAAQTLAKFRYYPAVNEIIKRDDIMAIDAYGGPLLGEFGAQVIPDLLDFYRAGGNRTQTALSGIANIHDPAAIPQLIDLVKGKDRQIAASATKALAAMPGMSESDKKIVEEVLLAKLHDKNSFIRSDSYAGLLKIDARKHLRLSMDALRTDPDARLEILYSYIRNPVPEAKPYLEEFIKYDETQRPNDPLYRKIAAQAIFKISGERVPFRGLEQEQKIYKDPYDPSKHF